jgi:hypothetical protein
MKVKPFLFGLFVAAGVGMLPTLAHPIVGHTVVAHGHPLSATAIYCSDDDFFSEGGFSRFVSSHGHISYQGGGIGDDFEEAGFRIDTPNANTASFQTLTDAQFLDVFVGWSDGPGNPVLTPDYDGWTSSFNPRTGVESWAFNRRFSSVPSGAAIVSIYCVAGSDEDGPFSMSAVNGMVNAHGVPPTHGTELDCADD